MKEPEYKPTEDDILTMMRYLRLNIPEQATPEKAILLLKHYQSHIEALQELHPEEVEKVLQNLEDH